MEIFAGSAFRSLNDSSFPNSAVMFVSYRGVCSDTIIERLVTDVNEVKQNILARTMQSFIVVFTAFRFESIKLEHAFFKFLFFYDFLIHFVLKYRLHSRLNDFKRVVFLH